MRSIKWLVAVLLLIATLVYGLAFSVQNAEPVALNLLFADFSPQSLSFWLIGALSFGVLVGLLINASSLFLLRWQLKAMQRRLHKANKTIEDLSLAVEDKA